MPSATHASQNFEGEVGTVDEKVLTRYKRLDGLPEAELLHEAFRTLRYELDLPSDLRRRHVIERLRAWLLLEPEHAAAVARAFADASERLDASERELLAETEENAVLDGLSYREFQRLAAFVPSLEKWNAASSPDPLSGDAGMPASLAAALILAGAWEF
jgi:hypothetical protein